MRIFIVAIIVCFLSFNGFIQASEKLDVILLTDIGGDPDDEQSLVRFLLYSDMFNVKAICATSRLGHGQDIKPELIRKQIEAYRQVYPNLILHSEGYPSPDYLASIVKNGQADQFNYGKEFDSEASDYMIKVIDEAKGTVYIPIWGGQRELAQTLWKIQETRSKEQVETFCKKILVHAIGDQDKHRDWILKNFSDIRYIADGYIFPGNFGIRELASFRGMYMTGDVSMQNGDWVRTNILGNGALSNCYQLNGAGTDGMKEGDSPSFLGLISNGLNFAEKPQWGGWGGRFRLLNNNLFIDAHDFLGGTLNERHSVSRWRPAFQRDFMARIKWCVEPFANANHNPVIKVNKIRDRQPLYVETKSGDKLVFDASKSQDPDGNKLAFNWFFYDEISLTGVVDMKLSSAGKKCAVKIPEHLTGRTIHLILEVSDNGTPSLTSYKRIIIKVL